MQALHVTLVYPMLSRIIQSFVFLHHVHNQQSCLLYFTRTQLLSWDWPAILVSAVEAAPHTTGLERMG